MNEQDNKLTPTIISRADHSISRANISENALKVLYRLKNAGYQAHLVGGGVRDLSLGREPKDFDVATDATPEDVKALFRNCRLIGRRFRLAHVHFGREIIEVATFRALHDGNGEETEGGEVAFQDGRIVRDNAYGTLEEDALRRDFTVNGLYYNIADYSVVDYVGGMADLQAGLIRLIGDPEVRYREDPVRMLRAVRFAAKLGFLIEQNSAEPIGEMAATLEQIPPARLFEEVLKLLMGGMGVQTFEALRHYGLFNQLFPGTDQALDSDPHGQAMGFVSRALANTDARIAEDKPVTPAFLFAALLWPQLRHRAEARVASGDNLALALQEAGSEVLAEQMQRVAIPKRFSLPMREIWLLQPRFERTHGKRAQRLLSHPRFRAAYDFLLLRAAVGEVPEELAQWWTEVQDSPEAAQAAQERSEAGARRRPRRRRGGRRCTPSE
nr:polynucleotide adenylyltransferase PcnB [Alkalilimnicola sp. S0819]